MESLDINIPTGLQILLADLDFLSQITRGKKPCMSERVLIDADSWLGAFYRSWKGENRLNVMSSIEQIINRTVDAIVDHKNTKYIGILINYVNNARCGISNLLETYKNDPKMIARIRVQLQNIDLQLGSYRHLIKGYGKDAELQKGESPTPTKEPEDIKINLTNDFFESTEKRKMRKPRSKRSIEK